MLTSQTDTELAFHVIFDPSLGLTVFREIFTSLKKFSKQEDEKASIFYEMLLTRQ